MQIVPVGSNIIIGVGYDEPTRTLVIELKDGMYKYDSVPLNIYNRLISAPSKATFYAENIKTKFIYDRLN